MVDNRQYYILAYFCDTSWQRDDGAQSQSQDHFFRFSGEILASSVSSGLEIPDPQLALSHHPGANLHQDTMLSQSSRVHDQASGRERGDPGQWDVCKQHQGHKWGNAHECWAAYDGIQQDHQNHRVAKGGPESGGAEMRCYKSLKRSICIHNLIKKKILTV